MDNHNFLWENPLFLWPFSIAMLNYQRVRLARPTGLVFFTLFLQFHETRITHYYTWYPWPGLGINQLHHGFSYHPGIKLLEKNTNKCFFAHENRHFGLMFQKNISWLVKNRSLFHSIYIMLPLLWKEGRLNHVKSEDDPKLLAGLRHRDVPKCPSLTQGIGEDLSGA